MRVHVHHACVLFPLEDGGEGHRQRWRALQVVQLVLPGHRRQRGCLHLLMGKQQSSPTGQGETRRGREGRIANTVDSIIVGFLLERERNGRTKQEEAGHILLLSAYAFLSPCLPIPQMGTRVRMSKFGLTKIITISPFFMLQNKTSVSRRCVVVCAVFEFESASCLLLVHV